MATNGADLGGQDFLAASAIYHENTRHETKPHILRFRGDAGLLRGAGWAFDVACDTGIPAAIGGGVMTSKGTIGGDINTRYEIQMTAAQAGKARNATIKAEWKGRVLRRAQGRRPGEWQYCPQRLGLMRQRPESPW